MTDLSRCRFCPKCGAVTHDDGLIIVLSGDYQHVCRELYPERIPAGADLDRLVADMVLQPRGKDGAILSIGILRPTGWSPSTNIAHAWEVVERMRTAFGVALGVTPDVAGWDVSEYGAVGDRLLASADTAPLAICRAALAAVTIARKPEAE